MPIGNPQLNALGQIDDLEVYDDPVDLLGYQRDASVVSAGSAELLLRPRTTQAVQQAIVIANQTQTPVYVRGAGSMYAGGVNPHAGGIVVDMTAMDQILNIDAERGLVVVQPGVRFGSLLKALKPLGLTIGIVPLTGPTATVGGAAAAHALGTGSVRYQSFADEVAGLEVVLADGECVRTGSAASAPAGFFQRNCLGPDLTGLFLGSDASFGISTAIALWLHPLPAHRMTFCVGFRDVESGARCIAALQNADKLSNVWYSSTYHAASIAGRIQASFPDKAADDLPQFCIGFDLGGDSTEITASKTSLLEFCGSYAGEDFADFNAAFFSKLRYDETFWYAYAGYFTKSRSGLLMTSLPTILLPDFYQKISEFAEKYQDFIWAPGAILCRRGLHGGVITFYDERTQWDAMQDALAQCAGELMAIGCVPYKSGKIWAEQLQQLGPHHDLLTKIKHCLDPRGVLSPGNLGLGISEPNSNASD